MPETKAFIEVSNSLLSLRESENHNETIVESCNRNLANRIGTFIKIIEAQDKEIERLKADNTKMALWLSGVAGFSITSEEK